MDSEEGGHFGCLVVQSTIIARILETIKKDKEFQIWFFEMATKEPEVWSIDTDKAYRYRGRLCIPNEDQLRKDILDEVHKSRMIIYLGGTKMYKDLKRNFWWEGMKQEVATYVSQCLTCQQVKAEH